MNKQDLDNYKMLRAVIKSGKFDLKGEAILKVASLFAWFDSLETRLIEKIKIVSAPEAVEQTFEE